MEGASGKFQRNKFQIPKMEGGRASGSFRWGGNSGSRLILFGFCSSFQRRDDEWRVLVVNSRGTNSKDGGW